MTLLRGARTEEVKEWVGGEEMTTVEEKTTFSMSVNGRKDRWWLEEDMGSQELFYPSPSFFFRREKVDEFQCRCVIFNQYKVIEYLQREKYNWRFFLFRESQKGLGLNTWRGVGEWKLLKWERRKEKLDEDAGKWMYLSRARGKVWRKFLSYSFYFL